MDVRNVVSAVTQVVEAQEGAVVELLALELAHVGGGIGDVILG
jgi:hypothetical protein